VIVIDARMMGYSGIGTYLRALVPRVIAARPSWRFVLIGHSGVPGLTGLATDRVTVATCDAAIYTVAEQLEVPRRVPAGASVFWSPHYNIPVRSGVPLVVTIHDVCHLALPHLFGGAIRGAYARWMLAAVRRRARQVIFVSEFSRQEFRRFVGEPAAATTIHSGVDPAWHMLDDARLPSPHPRPYLLAVGSPRPHKNLSALIQAYTQLLGTIEHDLVLIGDWGASRSRDEQFLRHAASLAPRVSLQGPVPEPVLRQFMVHAAALVFPSLYEGFGLPPLEAMAAGCPCVVSRAASLPEICGDAAAYCDPTNPTDIAAQILRVVESPTTRDRLVQAGREHVSGFCWEATTDRTVAVLEAAIGRRSVLPEV
jgi:glycosyltransferase involved in cell wall biosynthesis